MKQTDIFIFLGPPGSGKGSLSSLCTKRLGWLQFSTGNLCRQHIANSTEIGKRIDFIIKSGKLISDDLIMEMVSDWLIPHLGHTKSIIFDGLPRTVEQAQKLADLFKSLPIRVYVVRLAIEDAVIVERVKARAICQNKECQAVHSLYEHSPQRPQKEMTCNECSTALIKRAEDEEKVLKERLRIYHEHESKIMDFYRSQEQQVHQLDVEASLEDVYKQLLSFVGQKV